MTLASVPQPPSSLEQEPFSLRVSGLRMEYQGHKTLNGVPGTRNSGGSGYLCVAMGGVLNSECTGLAGAQGPWRGLVGIKAARNPAWSPGAC